MSPLKDCSIIYCEECGATNVLQLDNGNEHICPEELLECWCCGSELVGNVDIEEDTTDQLSIYEDGSDEEDAGQYDI